MEDATWGPRIRPSLFFVAMVLSLAAGAALVVSII
jgi:hypothetical protein